MKDSLRAAQKASAERNREVPVQEAATYARELLGASRGARGIMVDTAHLRSLVDAAAPEPKTKCEVLVELARRVRLAIDDVPEGEGNERVLADLKQGLDDVVTADPEAEAELPMIVAMAYIMGARVQGWPTS